MYQFSAASIRYRPARRERAKSGLDENFHVLLSLAEKRMEAFLQTLLELDTASDHLLWRLDAACYRAVSNNKYLQIRQPGYISSPSPIASMTS